MTTHDDRHARDDGRSGTTGSRSNPPGEHALSTHQEEQRQHDPPMDRSLREATMLDTVLYVLAHRRRRDVIRVLRRGQESMTVDDVIGQVIDRETRRSSDVEVAAVESDLRTRQLPRLERTQFVARSGDSLEYHDDGTLEMVLETLPEFEGEGQP